MDETRAGPATVYAGLKAFTLAQVGRVCLVATRTVQKWFDGGRLKGYRVNGSGVRKVPRADLVAFLTEYGFTSALESLGESGVRP